jgi:hypothetical protein
MSESLAKQLLEDRQSRADRPRYVATTCFACGRPYQPKSASGDDSTRFCSANCRQAFDNGFPPYSEHSKLDPFAVTRWKVTTGGDPGYLVATPMRMGRNGFFVACRGCGNEFESKGLAFHSPECRRA